MVQENDPLVNLNVTFHPARIIHDGSSRPPVAGGRATGPRAVALRDGRPEPREPEAYLKQYVEGLSGEAARLAAGHMQPGSA